jgi:RNA polymerase sigma-70 factor (ECF subfamily)
LDRVEFEARALEHFDAVYRMAMQLSRRPEDAADLVQETFLKALKAADRFEPKGGGIRPWLFKILRNVFYSRVVKEQRGPSASENIHFHASANPGPGEALPAWNLAAMNWEQVDDRLKTAINSLNPEYREVLLLWGVEGMKYREIALIVDVPIGTVMSRLFRARAALAQQLGPLAAEVGIRVEDDKSDAD